MDLTCVCTAATPASGNGTTIARTGTSNRVLPPAPNHALAHHARQDGASREGTPAARELSRRGGAIMNAYGNGITWLLIKAAFNPMRAAGLTPDVTTYISLFNVCAEDAVGGPSGRSQVRFDDGSVDFE